MAFLAELQDMRALTAGPWLVGGDFNMIASTEDKNNDRINHRPMHHFHRFITDLVLRDIYLHGRRYTWSSEQQAPTLVRNDRVMCTTDWETLQPHHVLRCLSSAASDHCPMLVDCSPRLGGKRRFHFERFWPKLEGFQQTVSEAWNSVLPDDDPFRRIYAMLKATARHLQSWSERTIGNISTLLLLTCKLILCLDMAQDLC